LESERVRKGRPAQPKNFNRSTLRKQRNLAHLYCDRTCGKGSQLSAIAGDFEDFWGWWNPKKAGSRRAAEGAEKGKL
jgi:hypothetical protein